MTIQQEIETAPLNENIQKTLLISNQKLKSELNPVCSISGGSDSDIYLDVIERTKPNDLKIKYVFFDTGLEYQATHKHLTYLENKYNIKIDRYKAITPIPTSCKKYGQPFFSKYVSDMIHRLQKHNFTFTDEPFETLLKKYPKCKSALRWWCNKYKNKKDGRKSKFGINNIKFLKEFMIENPPDFMISSECCHGAKKKTSYAYDKQNNPSIKLNGIRRAESGARATAYKNCFTPESKNSVAEYRPLFFWSDDDKKIYKDWYNISYSNCYEIYGLERTGCAGCPFGSKFESELKIIKKYEPKLYSATQSIFGKSYEYTRKYRQFKQTLKNANPNQLFLENTRI